MCSDLIDRSKQFYYINLIYLPLGFIKLAYLKIICLKDFNVDSDIHYERKGHWSSTIYNFDYESREPPSIHCYIVLVMKDTDNGQATSIIMKDTDKITIALRDT